MTTHRKLGQSLLFRWALALPLLVGSLLLLLSLFNNPKLEPCFSSACVNYFFELYKYPLSILGLSVPFTAIAAALHRSEETALQISASSKQFEETLKQNIFNNYIKHKEEFFSLIEKIEINCQCRFADAPSLYKKIFPRNSYSSFDFVAHNEDDALSDQPHEFLEKINRNVRRIPSTLYDPTTDSNALISLLLDIQETSNILQIKQASSISYKSESKMLVWPDEFAENTSKNLRFILKALTVFSFYKVRDVKDDLAVNLRLPNSGSRKISNMRALDQLVVDIDEYL